MYRLLRSCEVNSEPAAAVPRSRVYARYVAVCANERIKPLNPASFGKLVRLMYPDIKTRRLGVRGQSKYHYCGIKLVGEPLSPKQTHTFLPAESGITFSHENAFSHENNTNTRPPTATTENATRNDWPTL